MPNPDHPNLGAPLKRTKAQVIAAIKRNKGQLYLTAKSLDIAYETLRNYVLRWPELRKVIHEAKGQKIDRVEGKSFLIAMRVGTKKEKAGDGAMVRYLLSTQGKARGYTERTEVRHGGDAAAPPIATQSKVIMVDELDLPLEVNKAILEKLRERNGRVLANGGVPVR